MKIKLNTNLVINITVICCIIIMAALYIVAAKTETTVVHDEFSKPLDLSAGIDETIPDTVRYQQYQNMTDSIKMMRSLKNGEAVNSLEIKIGNIIGTSCGLYCDTCSLKWYNENLATDETHKQYYVTLPGWGINDSEYAYIKGNFVRFYVKNRQSYLHQNDKDIPVKFRYNHKDHCLMIPVSKSSKDTLSVILDVFAVMLGLYFLYLITCFLNFLIDLSKGLSFTDGNLRRLLTIAISLLSLPLLVYLSNLLIKLIFHSYFTPEVIMNRDVWKDSWKTISVGIIFLLLFRAFRQGKLLKDEQDLTV